jgi:hypothetical protein
MIELDALELVFKGLHSVAVCLHLLTWQLVFFMIWSITSCESPLTSKRLMPISMVIRRPQRRASYSTILLDGGGGMSADYIPHVLPEE